MKLFEEIVLASAVGLFLAATSLGVMKIVTSVMEK